MSAFAGGDSRIEIPRAPTKNPKSETMTSTPDDAELLKDLKGLDKPPLFDENDTDASFFPVSEDDSILLRHVDDVVDTSPDKCHRHKAIGEVANPRNQHIEMPQIQYTDKVADDSVAVPRQISPRATETKAPEHQWDDRCGDPDKDVQGEATTKHCWSEGKNTVSIYLELDGLDDVTDDAFKAEYGKTNVSLTIASVAGKERIFKLTGLADEITGVKVAQKKGKQTVSLKLTKKEEKLFDDASTKEAVADDTANSNTNITSCVNQTTLSTRRRLTIRHAAWILTRCNVRRSTGVIFVRTLVHCSFLARRVNPGARRQKSSRFEESVGDSTNDQNSAKMPEMWIANTNPGRRSTVMDLASATPLNESKFSGEQTTVTTSSLHTMERSWELDVGEWERAANSTINTSWSE